MLLAKFVEIRYENLQFPHGIQYINEHLSILYGTTIRAAQLIVDYRFAKMLYKESHQKKFDIVSSIIFYNSPYFRSEMWDKKMSNT